MNAITSNVVNTYAHRGLLNIILTFYSQALVFFQSFTAILFPGTHVQSTMSYYFISRHSSSVNHVLLFYSQARIFSQPYPTVLLPGTHLQSTIPNIQD